MVVMVMAMSAMAFVIMVVIVGVGSDHARCGGAEKFGEFRVLLHDRGAALAADVGIEADHVVALRHHHVQIVAYHEDAAAMGFADGGDQFIQFDFAVEIHRLHRFVQHQQLRLTHGISALSQQSPPSSLLLIRIVFQLSTGWRVSLSTF